MSLIIAPILALISYFSVDFIVSEKPHKAVDGNFYKMRVNSNCRWDSGKCNIDNEDLNIEITGKYINIKNEQSHKTILKGILKLYITSNVSLNGIKIAFDKSKIQPISMDNKENLYKWETSLNNTENKKFINIVISANKSVFFANIPTVFIK